MEEYFETFPEEVTKWETIRNLVDLDLKITDNEDNNRKSKQIHTVQLLPRQDVVLYGIIPKMEQTSYTKCKECRLVFNPRDILEHKACSRKYHSLSTPSSSQKSKNKRNNNKKTHSPLPPPPVFKKPPSPSVSSPSLDKTPPKMSLLALLSKVSGSNSTSSTTTSTTNPQLDIKVSSSKESSKFSMTYPSKLGSSSHTSSIIREASNSNSQSSGSSSRHKKSKKSSSSSRNIKEADINDNNFGITDLSKRQEIATISIPLTQSIITDNINIKNDKKPEEDAIDVIQKNKTLSTAFPPSPKIQPANPENISSNEIKTENIDIPENKVDALPVVYMPMSPISVITLPQDIKPNKDFYVCFVKSEVKNENVSNNSELEPSKMEIPITTNGSRLYSIPNNHNLNIKRYKTHPKPIAVPTYSTKKIGGAILLSNQRIEHQRNDILMAINKNRSNNTPPSYNRGISLLNHTNSSIRPNILKVKSMNKVSCKRNSNEKLSSSENKQIRLTSNINGFILHSDIIDTPDSSMTMPNNNNCIQEKIAYFM